MEWISVERKLTGSGSPVFVAAGRYITIAHWDAGESRFKMLSREDAAMILSGDVTHWTPLPESPRERRNDWPAKRMLPPANQALDRYSRGLTPNSARNVRLKLETSPNPQPSAMSKIFVGSSRRRIAARRSRALSKY